MHGHGVTGIMGLHGILGSGSKKCWKHGNPWGEGHGIPMGRISKPLGLKDLGFPLGSHNGSQGVPKGGSLVKLLGFLGPPPSTIFGPLLRRWRELNLDRTGLEPERKMCMINIESHSRGMKHVENT